MSLKAFHLVFIICSILMVFGFSAWSWVAFSQQGGALYAVYGISGLLSGLVLLRYSRYFLRKLRHISYL